MNLTRALCQFTKWFHVLGQSSYSSIDAFSQSPYVANFLPSIALLTLMVSAAITACYLILRYTQNTFLNYVVIVLCVSSMTFTVFIAVSQSIFYRVHYVKLYQRINTFELLIRNRFSINFPAFRRYYLRQISIVLISCISALMGTLLLRPDNLSDLTTTLTVATLRFVTLITVCHLLFYVCLFQYLVRAFVDYVEIHAITSSQSTATDINVIPIQRRRMDTRNIIIELNYFKMIHFVLWEISDSINQVFGWTIVAVLLQLCFYAIYNVYFAFLLLVEPKAESIRKLVPIGLSYHNRIFNICTR